jgi:DsbC/DsbD-like thiol-disulfide interchange protein
MRAPRILTLAATLAAVAPASGEPTKDADAASPWAELHASRVRLLADRAKAASGARLAGVEIAMQEGWKTYWRNPGDAGVPPQFNWSGSANAAAIRVLYPAPMRMREPGGDVIGYKHAVIFPVEVTPQDASKPVALKLSLEYGICREICVPAVATIHLSLPPGRNGAPSEAIKAATDRVPRPQVGRRPGDPELRKVTVSDGEPATRLTITAAFHGRKGADVFIEAPDGLYVPLPRLVAEDGTGVGRYEVNLSGDLARDLKGKTLTFTLVSDAGATEAQWTFP